MDFLATYDLCYPGIESVMMPVAKSFVAPVCQKRSLWDLFLPQCCGAPQPFSAESTEAEKVVKVDIPEREEKENRPRNYICAREVQYNCGISCMSFASNDHLCAIFFLQKNFLLHSFISTHKSGIKQLHCLYGPAAYSFSLLGSNKLLIHHMCTMAVTAILGVKEA